MLVVYFMYFLHKIYEQYSIMNHDAYTLLKKGYRMKVIIKGYKQFFKVLSSNIEKVLYDLFPINKSLITYRLDIKKGKKKIVTDKKFFLLDNRDSSIRYPITRYSEIHGFLKEKGYDIDEKIIDPPTGKDIEIEPNPKFKLRDYQEEYVNEISKARYPTLLINLRTGAGKTLTVLYAMAKLKKRFMVLVLAKYVDKWIEDITHYTNIKEEEIFVVQGSKTLRKLLSMKQEELDKYKAFVLSLNTITNYIKTWLNEDEVFDYEKSPEELTYHLDIGYVINDESHQEFHNVFYTQLFFNSKLFIGLTATLEHNTKRVNDMYYTLFPTEARPNVKVNYDKYINVLSVSYRFRVPRAIKYKRAQGYNHVLLEKSINNLGQTLVRYFNFIFSLLNLTYLKRRKKGDKALIFFSTVDMCKQFVNYLRYKKECKGLKINKYTEEDSYEIIEKSDIIVSTLLSSGTALDIPNLITVIQTIAISSVQANKQSIGRLRNLKDKDVVFVYIWSRDIPNHQRYHHERIKYFRGIAKSYKEFEYKEKL